jgi:hypothetical protein
MQPDFTRAVLTLSLRIRKPWIQGERLARWLDIVGSERRPKLPREGTNAHVLIESQYDYYSTERHVALGRVYSLGSPFWPGEPWEMAALRTWPSRRQTISLKLQALASLPVKREDLLRLFVANSKGGQRRAASTRAQELLLESMQLEFRFYIPVEDSRRSRQVAYDFVREWRVDNTSRGSVRAASGIVFYLLDYRRGGPARVRAQDIASYWARNGARVYPAPEFVGETIISDEAPDSGKVEIHTLGFGSPRAFFAHMEHEPNDPIFNLFSLASRVSLRPEEGADELKSFLASNAHDMDPLWPALARHIARLSTEEDRQLLEDLTRHPEKREPPLSWVLKYYVRGDVVMVFGTGVTLDELSVEAGVRPLPYLEQMREEPRIPRELLGRFRSR